MNTDHRSHNMDTMNEIRSRLEAATPGPWEIDRYPKGGARIATNFGNGSRKLIADTYQEADREFFYNAPSDVARLLAAVEAVTALHREELSFAPEGTVQDCYECELPYPCPTVKAVQAALGGAA